MFDTRIQERQRLMALSIRSLVLGQHSAAISPGFPVDSMFFGIVSFSTGFFCNLLDLRARCETCGIIARNDRIDP